MNAPVKNGQRVRVVLEGEATGSGVHGFWIGRAWDTNHINPAAEHVVSVEILRPPVTVGDAIETAEQLDALPTNTVVLNDKGCALQTDGDEWFPANCHSGPVARRPLPATVIYLPDGAA